jgi:hypothetical protein
MPITWILRSPLPQSHQAKADREALLASEREMSAHQSFDFQRRSAVGRPCLGGRQAATDYAGRETALTVEQKGLMMRLEKQAALSWI